MIVKLLTRSAGVDHNFAPNSIIKVDAAKGKDLIDGKYAVLVEDDPKHLEPEQEDLESLTKADIKSRLDALGAEYVARDTKAVLLETLKTLEQK